MAAFGLTFWWSTGPFPPANRQISYIAIAVETLAALGELLVMGFGTPLYFTTLPFYLILGHIHAVFDNRPGWVLSGLLWLSVIICVLTGSLGQGDISFLP